MKRLWTVSGVVSGGKHVGDYEAETGEEAIALAAKSGDMHVALCHQCSDQCSDLEIHKLIATALKPGTTGDKADDYDEVEEEL